MEPSLRKQEKATLSEEARTTRAITDIAEEAASAIDLQAQELGHRTRRCTGTSPFTDSREERQGEQLRKVRQRNVLAQDVGQKAGGAVAFSE